MSEIIKLLPKELIWSLLVIIVLLIVFFVGLLILAFVKGRPIKLFRFIEIGHSERFPELNKQQDHPSIPTDYTELNKISLLLGTKGDLASFRKEIVKRVLKNTHDEINRIIGGAKYEVDIGIESNFLLRAKPLFANAEKIYAISLNNVSNFWIEKGSQPLAREYLKSQPESTKRLFVFDGAQSLDLYWSILSKNYTAYGYKGAVLITDRANYTKFLAQVLTDENVYLQYQKKDFGLLYYHDHWLLAELDNNCLTFEPVPDLASFRLDSEKMINLFDEFSGSGENYKVINEINVVKWQTLIVKEEVIDFLFQSTTIDQNAILTDAPAGPA
jgi:hypothetical protein